MRETFRAYAELIGIGFKAAPWAAAFQIFTGVFFAVATPIMALGAKLLVNAAISGDLRNALLAAALLAVALGGALTCVFYYVHCLFTVQERAGAFASRRLMELVGGAEGLAHFERPEYLDQVQRIREEQFRLASMVNATAGLVRVVATLAITAVLLVQVDPLLLILPALALVSFWFGKLIRDLKVAAQEATSEAERLRRHLFELGTSEASAGELRVYGLTRLLHDRHHQVSDDVIGQRNRASWRVGGLQAIDATVSALGYVGAIVLVVALVLNKQASAGDIVLVVALAAQMNSNIGTAILYGTEFLFVMRVGQRFMWLKRYAASVSRTPESPAPIPDSLHQGIELRDVRFAYPGEGRNRAVLSGVSLKLPAGAVVALVGDNGAGKSTLVKLLCGFAVPDSGQILVDATELAAFDPVAWRARCSAAFQDFSRLEFLARETIGVGDLARIDDREAVLVAAGRAGATDVVDGLPNGLDTQLGNRWEGGVELSGGQWQKLALARGLMRAEPLLVVFDEPTANLDAHTEHALFERFAQAARTARQAGTITLLVSHRFSTVGMADLIAVLDDGKIKEFGSHQELMALGGTYAELYGLQSRGYR